MSVESRVIESLTFGSFRALGAVRNKAETLVAFPAGTAAKAVRAKLGAENCTLRAAGRGLIAIVEGGQGPDAPGPDTQILRGMNTLVAIRNGETAKAACDWLTYHATHHQAEAALILDRDPPGGAFAGDLKACAPPVPVVVVQTEHPLGRPDAPDARHPSLAPGAPKREAPAVDPWHSPLGELAIFELLRRRFLSKASAVLLLDIADLLLPNPDDPIFEQIKSHAGSSVPFEGIECYPWRLRQGAAAPFSDHIALRRNERRRIASWGSVPAALPDAVVWKPGRLARVPVAEVPTIPFRRALGVTFPGVPVNRLVRKADLIEDPVLLALSTKTFGADPIRLPGAEPIAPRPASGSVTVITAMKNEGPFILDWIAHNRVIGVNDHLVYTNDCDDGTEALLDALAPAGVTRRDNPFRKTGNVPQHAALRAAETEGVVLEADWLMTLDVDEYINVHMGDGRLADLFDADPDAHVFSMPWRLFGNGHHHGFEDKPVTERFTLAAPEYAPRPLQAWAFKTVYRNAGLFRRIGVHRPKGLNAATEGAIRWLDGAGRPIPSNTWKSCWRVSKANWGYDLVTLNHYAVRSAESFLVKRDRGRANHTDRDQGLAYWFRMNHNAVEDRSIQRHGVAVAAEKARLMALPGVAEAHAGCIGWHRARIAELMQDAEQARLYAQTTSLGMENLSRMATKFGANVHHYGPEVIPDDIAMRDPDEEFFFTVEAKD